MSAQVKLEGFDELIQALTHAPEAIRAQGMQIIHEETEGAAVEIAMHYPTRSGTLARRVKTEYPSSTILVGIVRSAAPHAHLFEFGTQRRQTNNGANRGVMPKASPPIVVPIAQKRRARMFRRLEEMLVRMGFHLTQHG